MMDSELKKSSVRANKLEKKRFEMMMSAFDSAKRNVAVDMKKSQLDFKRRLKRYRERQREIVVTRSGPSSSSMEEFVLKQLTRRSSMHPAQLALRPHTCPNPQYSKYTPSISSTSSDNHRAPGTSHGSYRSPGTSHESHRAVGTSHESHRTQGSSSESHYTTGTSHDSHRALSTSHSVRTRAGNGSHGSDDTEENEDFGKLSHCTRSKVDLRPCTSWSAVRRNIQTEHSHSRPNPSGVKLLQLRGGSLGTPAKQVRYLNDEQIEERCTFYRFLLDGYRHIEHERLETLKDRVEVFCGKASNKQSSCPPLVKVVSLPAGVPPIIHQAMKVKIPHMSPVGLLQRAKTQ